jgi:hypothetical protein
VFVAGACIAVGGALLITVVRPARAYETRFPAAVPDLVRTSGATVLADDASADWLLWRVPSLRGRLGYDVRFEVLTPAQIRRLLAWERLEPGWAAVPKGFGVVVDDPQHVSRLVATGRWRRVFGSPRLAVAERIHDVG